MEKKYDENQQAVINFDNGKAIVLGAPGCGKTDILAMRVAMATQIHGHHYDEMLCVTFTNRASRNMKERVKQVVGNEALNRLFIGNLHRFCIRFLFENEIIPIDTCLIDDVDQHEILDEMLYIKSSRAYRIGLITTHVQREFMVANGFPARLFPQLGKLDESSTARRYAQYKRENHLIDFDDLLLLTYKALMEPNYRRYKYASYKWIQVDEMQDLTPLQFAIIEKLVAPDFSSVVYLGDQQQAIYSFLGAQEKNVVSLINEAGDNVFLLYNNYRSPAYLLNVLNDFATDVLDANAKLLPTTRNHTTLDDGLVAVHCNDNEQAEVAAMLVRNLTSKSKACESTAVLVRNNAMAEEISQALNNNKIKHIKITNKDIFKSSSFKMLYSHFAVVANEARYNDWTQILYLTRCFTKKTSAARFVSDARQLGLLPSDLMDYENSSYFIEFDRAYQNDEIVVFDTETTGLNAFEDDIIQIAAMRLRNGSPVYGSEIDIIIKTNKEIPTLLGGKPNPMVKVYEERRIAGNDVAHNKFFLDAQEAFETFVNYVGDAHLMGHNIVFDTLILDNNIKRRTRGITMNERPCWDTLKLSRMLDPKLRLHSLGSLLEAYGLAGINSHVAIDDIKATISLAQYCHNRVLALLPQHIQLLTADSTQAVQKKLLIMYRHHYMHTKNLLHSSTIDHEHSFMAEFKHIYNKFVDLSFIKPIHMFKYMCELFEKIMVHDPPSQRYFYQQLNNHLYELRTYNEGDLLQNGIIRENVHIMTVHKAKGLEFDNVILTNVNNGAYPHYNSDNLLDDAKVLYVGMSRARKRLYLTYVMRVSSFLRDNPRVYKHFYEMPQEQKERLLSLNRLFSSK